MKRFLCLLTMMVMLCTSALAEGAPLQDRALKLAQKVITLVGNKHAMAMLIGQSDMIKTGLEMAQGDYSKPMLTAKADLDAAIVFMQQKGLLPPQILGLTEMMRWHLGTTVPTMLLSSAGDLDKVALAGSTRHVTAFADATATGNGVYLFLFDGCAPVMVTWVCNEGAVYMTAMLLPLDSLSECRTVEDINATELATIGLTFVEEAK